MPIVSTGGLKSALPIIPAEQGPLYRSSVVIDAYAPLAVQGHADRYLAGGVTVACAPVYPVNGYLAETISGISQWYKVVGSDDRFMQVCSFADIETACRENKLGLLMMFHGTSHLQGDLSLLDIYYRLGLRQMMLTYTKRSLAGDGCTEKKDCGLSAFGEKLIERMHSLGIVLDLSYAGERTSMEAMELAAAAGKPCVFGHVNSRVLRDSDRNVSDEQIRKIAALGGVVGLTGYPPFVSTKMYPTLADYIDHIDHVVKIAGIDSVCLGMDYYKMQAGIMPAAEALAFYKHRIESGQWDEKNYLKPPYYYPEGIGLPEKLPNIVPALIERGYSESDVKKILGENYLRVLKAILK